MGHQQTSASKFVMSALPSKVDVLSGGIDVR
jgi:hypothetical protein